MRKLLRSILYKPVLWVANKYTSRPDRARVHYALTHLHKEILGGSTKKGPILPFDVEKGKYIIFSDQHKGAKNGADDFEVAEPNYLAALEYYNSNNFHFISLGDNEELWENTLTQVKKFNQRSFEAEKKFISRDAFTKIFGNHDLYWDNDPFASFQLKEIYDTDVPIPEGIILQFKFNDKHFSIFCTHGHQGDLQSDGNTFSKMFVSKVWGPLQAFLRINPNTPSTNDHLKTLHNQMMYEWSAAQHNLILITGHTHQPVFESMTHIESLYRKLDQARQENKPDVMATINAEIKLHGFAVGTFSEVKPTYFNSGCCCFDDGDITGIEISEGFIRLIKWDKKEKGNSERIVLEETGLKRICLEL